MSFRFSFIDVFINDSDILVEAEDRTCKEERLRHIVEQASCHVVDFDHLISHECDTAHDEQHRTGVLRDFEAFIVFHGLHRSASSCSEDESDEITDRLKDSLNCLVHNCKIFK